MLISYLKKKIKHLNNSLVAIVNAQSLESLFEYFKVPLNAEKQFRILGPSKIKSHTIINNFEKMVSTLFNFT